MYKLYIQPEYAPYGYNLLMSHKELNLKHWKDGGITSENGLEDVERVLMKYGVRYSVLRTDEKQCLDFVRKYGVWPEVQRIYIRGREAKCSVG